MKQDINTLPYKVAVLCYLYDQDDRLLLLKRSKAPNANKYSPIGGKLEARIGESPHACAVREIHEEAGIKLKIDDVRLSGVVSETAYEGETHWLIFLYEVTRPINPNEITAMEMDEGTLEWVEIDQVDSLDIPDTDREIIWSLVQKHREGFFTVHIDFSVNPSTWAVQEEWSVEDV
jgi:8-oxo-dGTP diphosphatase